VSLVTPLHTKGYALARSLLNLALFLTLAANDAHTLFPIGTGLSEGPRCEVAAYSAFCWLPTSQFDLVKAVCLVVLGLGVLGFYPRLLALPQWLIAFSVQATVSTIDGGSHVAYILTTLMLPLSLSDPRRNSWSGAAPILREPWRAFVGTSTVALRVQMAFIYFHAFVGKLFVHEWTDGTAVYYWFNNPALGISPWLQDAVHALVTTRLVVVITWGTLALEWLLATALFSSRRYYVRWFVLGVAFHAVIAVALGLVTFGLAMTAGLCLYFPGAVEALGSGVKQGWRFVYERRLRTLARVQGGQHV
jgi:antimicrobial peptide system SdpB family protein